MKLNKVYKLSFRRVQKCAELKSRCFWLLFTRFFLFVFFSVESMEPGQLSIILYSVCKINLNKESLSMNIRDFFF